MQYSLTTDLILQTVGREVKNTEETPLGEIIEITRDESGDFIEYAILKIKKSREEGDRFYAIPVSSSLIHITEGGEIILLVNDEDLLMANSITRDRCPSPNFNTEPSIFELIEYNGPPLGQ